MRAVDGSGNVDLTPAPHTWQVGAQPVGQPPETMIDSGPDLTTVATGATFAFSADESGVTFECALDAPPSRPARRAPQLQRISPDVTHTLRVAPPTATATWTPHRPRTLADQPPAVAAEVACGEFLTESTRVLNDIVDCPGHGLIVGAPGITIDLDGHVIDGVGMDAGILNHGHDSVTVTNGTCATSTSASSSTPAAVSTS